LNQSSAWFGNLLYVIVSDCALKFFVFSALLY